MNTESRRRSRKIIIEQSISDIIAFEQSQGILVAAVKAAHNNSRTQLEAISVDSSSVAAKKGATA